MENLKGLVRTRVNTGRIQNQTLPLSNITYRRLRSNCAKSARLKLRDNQLEFYSNSPKKDIYMLVGDYSNQDEFFICKQAFFLIICLQAINFLIASFSLFPCFCVSMLIKSFVLIVVFVLVKQLTRQKNLIFGFRKYFVRRTKKIKVFYKFMSISFISINYKEGRKKYELEIYI